jgi:hypothetical protein
MFESLENGKKPLADSRRHRRPIHYASVGVAGLLAGLLMVLRCCSSRTVYAEEDLPPCGHAIARRYILSQGVEPALFHDPNDVLPSPDLAAEYWDAWEAIDGSAYWAEALCGHGEPSLRASTAERVIRLARTDSHGLVTIATLSSVGRKVRGSIKFLVPVAKDGQPPRSESARLKISRMTRWVTAARLSLVDACLAEIDQVQTGQAPVPRGHGTSWLLEDRHGRHHAVHSRWRPVSLDAPFLRCANLVLSSAEGD